MATGLVYEDVLPIHWRKLEESLSTLQVSKIEQAGVTNLRMIAAMENFGSESHDEGNDQTLDLQRLEFKVDVMLELMTALVREHLEFPEAKKFILLPGQIKFRDQRADVAIGDWVCVDVYLNPNFPKPLSLIGMVQRVTESERDATWLEIDLSSGGERLRDELEKFLFRQHRRAVAQVRRV